MNYLLFGLVIFIVIASVCIRLCIMLKYFKNNKPTTVSNDLELISTLSDLKSKGIISDEEMNTMINKYNSVKKHKGDSFDNLEKLKGLGLINDEQYKQKLDQLSHLHNN